MVAGLDVLHDGGESSPWNAPPAAAKSHIVTRQRRARQSLVSGEILEAPVGEELPPEDQVARILGEIRVLHGGDSRLDLSGEVLVGRHRRNWDPTGAELSGKGETSVRRRRKARLVEQPGFHGCIVRLPGNPSAMAFRRS